MKFAIESLFHFDSFIFKLWFWIYGSSSFPVMLGKVFVKLVVHLGIIWRLVDVLYGIIFLLLFMRFIKILPIIFMKPIVSSAHSNVCPIAPCISNYSGARYFLRFLVLTKLIHLILPRLRHHLSYILFIHLNLRKFIF